MDTYDCNCKDITITEGIFGEIYAGVLSFHKESSTFFENVVIMI